MIKTPRPPTVVITTPDGCASCGHPRSWHRGTLKGGCSGSVRSVGVRPCGCLTFVAKAAHSSPSKHTVPLNTEQLDELASGDKADAIASRCTGDDLDAVLDDALVSLDAEARMRVARAVAELRSLRLFRGACERLVESAPEYKTGESPSGLAYRQRCVDASDLQQALDEQEMG